MVKAKRLLSVVLVGMVAVSTLSACGSTNNSGQKNDSATNSGSAGAGSSDKKVTLSLQTPYADESNVNLKTLRRLIGEYTKAHPNITINVDALTTDQQKLKLKTQAASNEIPDITSLNPGAQMKPFADEGLLAPLDDVLAKDGLKDTFKQGVLSNYTFGGKTYGLPETLDIAYVYYNKDLFKQAGVEIPSTYEELVASAKKFNAKGIIPLTIGEKETWTGSFFLMNIVLREAGVGFLKDVMDKKKKFTDAPYVQSLAKFKDFINAKGFEEGAVSVDYATAQNLFLSGKAAMYFTASWDAGSIENSTIKDSVGVFPFPTVDGKGDVSEFMLSPGNSYVISAASKHMAEAKDFLHFYMTNFPKVMFELKGGVGLAQNVDGDFKAAGYSQTAIDVLNLFKTVKGGDLAFDNTIDPTTTQTHLNGVQNVFVGDESAADTAKQLQNDFEMNNP
ncbi:ABC transporter substrate-binding protein [Paenibacillus baekrokdamisoli]|uniref:ABC transporter substrate-binding protein n=1 Tax=Paenibacillus baekrokdamisoli TaxID=1712516 RepID=A0A3G9IPQ7_9BACL|nr:extracellular solute-binding protein [Paenibacillus baekrokdamisoli]MBB3072045.1 raffinose/stachyose/melibiose transport system substrate-binding protein [Paenibacillus baekrokdamisoli]BBH20346.1 ABC transporter substrate-binding protein [Paenibacillus baekrokdamisoli]